MADDIHIRIADSFAKQGLMATLGASVVRVEAGTVVISMPFSPHLSQQHGFAHAGAITSIVDSACGYAALTLMPENAAVLTSEFKINLLAPAIGERFEAEGRVLRAGRRVHVAMGDVFAISGQSRKHIAVMLATLMVIEGESSLKS
ncbi:PaaI HGG motif-containing thioesterase, possibly involved in aromatic compounds catabolism [Rhabdaerophilaceae bacterium]